MAKYRILLAEDSEPDVALILRAFRDRPVDFRVVSNGEEALSTAFSEHFDLVILDLNLPRVRGDEVLEQLKRSPLTSHVPVVVMSSSNARSDISKAYALQAASFITKPITPSAFRDMAAKFGDYWFGVVEFR